MAVKMGNLAQEQQGDRRGHLEQRLSTKSPCSTDQLRALHPQLSLGKRPEAPWRLLLTLPGPELLRRSRGHRAVGSQKKRKFRRSVSLPQLNPAWIRRRGLYLQDRLFLGCSRGWRAFPSRKLTQNMVPLQCLCRQKLQNRLFQKPSQEEWMRQRFQHIQLWSRRQRRLWEV